MFQRYGIIIIISILLATTKDNQWQPIGPYATPMPPVKYNGWSPHGLGRIFDIAIHPFNNNKIWACSPNGGLYYTKNRGKNWSKIPLPCAGGAIKIDLKIIGKKKVEICIASSVTPANRAEYSYGIFSTTNNGKTWDTIHKLAPKEYDLTVVKDVAYLHDSLLYILNQDIYLYCKGQHKLLFKSEHEIANIKIFEERGEWYFTGKTILSSFSGGNDFTYIRAKREGPSIIANNTDVAMDNDGIVYALINAPNNVFYKIDNNLLMDGMMIDVSTDPRRCLLKYDFYHQQFLIGGIRLHRYNLSKSEQLTTPQYPNNAYNHDDIRAIALDNFGNIYLGHDGGISISEDNGKTWLLINGCGLNIAEIYDFDISEEHILVGTQDNGNHLFFNDKWTNISELYGDGGSCQFMGNDWFLMMGTTLLKTLDKGQSFEYAVFPIRLSRFNPKMVKTGKNLYLADKHIWKYEYDEWKNISLGIEHFYQISAFAVAKNEQIIYVAKEDPLWRSENLKDKFYKSNNGGKTWKDITAQFSSYSYRYITDITINDSNQNELWVCLGGFDAAGPERNKVFHSVDGAKTWNNISYQLPNVPCGIIKKIEGIGIVLGTDIGLYVLKNSAWIPYGQGLPTAIITQIRKTDNFLYIATYGNGLWRKKI